MVCERCRRPAPEEASEEYLYWEPVGRPDGSTGIVCPGCLTGLEEQALDEAVLEAEEEAVIEEATRRPQGPVTLN